MCVCGGGGGGGGWGECRGHSKYHRVIINILKGNKGIQYALSNCGDGQSY